MPLPDAVMRARMGNGPNAMNLGELKKRARDLRKSLGDLSLHLASAAGLTEYLKWADLLAQFSVISTQLSLLQSALRLELRHYALHPDAPTLDRMTADDRVRVVPLMLSIRLEMEMEAEMREALRGYDEAVAANPLLRSGFEGAALQQAVETHNELCVEAADGFDILRRSLKQPEPRNLLAAAKAVSVSPQAKALLAAAHTGEGLTAG